MKHGPYALIDETLPVVCIATQDLNDPGLGPEVPKGSLQHPGSTARSGRVIVIAIEGDTRISQLVEHVIHNPTSSWSHPKPAAQWVNVPLKLSDRHAVFLGWFQHVASISDTGPYR